MAFYKIITVTNGDPIKKYSFKKDVAQYLQSNYPYLEWELSSVSYAFKSMEFLALIVDKKSAIVFSVAEYNGELIDDYVSRIWEREIVNESAPLMKKLFEGDVKIYVRVLGQIDEYKSTNKTIPSYSETSLSIGTRTQISFQGEFTKDSYGELLQVIRWMVYMKYLADINFQSNAINITIPCQELGAIAGEDDLEKYRYY